LKLLAKATNHTVLSEEETNDLISFLNEPAEQKLQKFTEELDVILERDQVNKSIQLNKSIEELKANHNKIIQRKTTEFKKEMKMKTNKIDELTGQISELKHSIKNWQQMYFSLKKELDETKKSEAHSSRDKPKP